MFELTAPHCDKYYSFLDYQVASNRVRDVIQEYHGSAKTLLDVACGTGRYLEYLQLGLTISGLDISPNLVQQAKVRCPGVTFYLADMRNMALDARFDVITCLFCSIGYLISVEELQNAVSSMARHLNAGGILVIEPWISPEKCWTNRVTCDVVDEPELKIVRMHTHERDGCNSIYEIHTLVGTPKSVEHFVEVERMGLFTDKEYTGAIEDAGLIVSHLDIALFPDHNYGVYVGQSKF